MNERDIVRWRLESQRLDGRVLSSPQAVVRHFGAVQAQEYADAKWALGLRLHDATDAAIEKAVNRGDILRIHIMRPTWHFVAPEDIRWLTKLTAPRVRQAIGYQVRQLELTEDVLRCTYAVLEATLAGGKACTRKELGEALEGAGIAGAKGQQLAHLVMHAELEALVTSGPRRGKQFTYMLLEERVPPALMLGGEEALAELTRRYFTSHGPATPQDFAWWSGLTVADARRGVALVGEALEHETLGTQLYAFAAPITNVADPVPKFLPWFDEYTVAYKARSFVFGPESEPHRTGRDYATLSPAIIVKGKAVAFWKRILKKDGVVIELHPFRPLDDAEVTNLHIAAKRYRQFLGVPKLKLSGLN